MAATLVPVPGWRMGVFPFGRPVVACEPVATGRAAMFVLGAYPSALHVRWRPPQGEGRHVRALAVDNEPEPFWTGADEVHRVEQWMSQVGWSDAWGTVAPVSHLNGPSGLWVEERILGPLGVPRADAWITDSLNTYRASLKMRAAVEDVYEPILAPMHCHRRTWLRIPRKRRSSVKGSTRTVPDSGAS